MSYKPAHSVLTLLGNNIRCHGLRAQSHKTAPLPVFPDVPHSSDQLALGRVYYTHADKDGKQVQELEFDKPADPNSWSLVDRSPTNAEGRDGDFWFDSFSKTIFSKSNGVWSPVINFNDQSTSYKVTFYINYGDNTAPYTQSYINHGCYYSSTGKSIPIPTREGYVFAGWYTKAEDVNPVVNAPFTDLTPVNGTLDLYAKWDEEPATSE